MTARELRALAEAADGYRDEPLYLVYDPTTEEYLLKEKLKGGEDVVFIVKTQSLEHNRIKPDSIVITVAGQPLELKKEYDSAFWTESSIEKFLLPYYAAARVLDENQLAALRASYNDKQVVALLHTWPTRTKVLRAPDIKVARRKTRGAKAELEIIDVLDFLDKVNDPSF